MMRAPESDFNKTMERVGLIASLTIIVVVAAIRLPGESMWVDEAYTRASINDFWMNLRTYRGTMILYIGVLRVWAIVSTTTWWLRIPSVLAAMVTLFVLRPVARRIGGSCLVAVALPLMAVSTGFLWAATDMRSYALEILLAVVAWYCYLRADIERGMPSEQTWWRLLAVTSVLGVLTHGLFVFQLIPIALVAAVALGPVKAVRKLAPTIVLSAATLGGFLWVGNSANGTYTPGGPSAWVGSSMEQLLSPIPVFKILLAELLALSAVLAYLRMRSGDRHVGSLQLVGVTWAIVPVVTLGLVSLLSPTFNPRYVLPTIPGIALSLGMVGVATDDWIRRRGRAGQRRIPAGIASIALVALALGSMVKAPFPEHQNWRGAVSLVAFEAKSTDGIVFADRWNVKALLTRPGFEATWEEHARATTPVAVSPVRPLGRALPDDDPLTPPAIFKRMQAHPRVWFVERQQGQSVTDAITNWGGFSGYSKVSSWQFSGGIHVSLWQRDA